MLLRKWNIVKTISQFTGGLNYNGTQNRLLKLDMTIFSFNLLKKIVLTHCGRGSI